MQNSAKYLIAVLIGFAVLFSSILISWVWNKEVWSVLAFTYTLGISAVLSIICIIIAVRHKKTRRYFISLCMVLLCDFFAELYIGIHDLLFGMSMASAVTLPIPEIAYLGADVFLAALCARIWYEEIQKSVLNRGKITAVSIVSVFVIVAIGAVGFFAGHQVFSGILYLVTGVAILCYSARFFFVPAAAAKPYLPLMTIISVFAVYSTVLVFIIPMLPGAVDELAYYLLSCPTLLIMMLCIPALTYAGEWMREKAGKNTTAEPDTAEKGTAGEGTVGEGMAEKGAAKEKTALPDTGEGKPFRTFTISKKNICLVLLFFLFGVLVCFIAGYVNSFIAGALGISMVDSAVVAAPIAEECLKAVPILLFFLWLRPDFKSLLRAAIAVGVGFAVLETIEYAIAGFSLPAEIVLRLFSTGIMHAMTVSLFAASLWYVTQKGLTPSWFITVMCGFGILAGGITLHGCFNMLINSMGFTHYVGFIIPIVIAVVYAACLFLWNKRKKRVGA